MINYSQMVTDNSEIKEQAFVFSKVFDEVFDEMKPTAEEKHIEFKNHNVLNGYVFSGDKEKIKTLFENILSNAVKFTPEGGKIDIVLESKGKEAAQVYIKDNGQGIAEDVQSRIFTPNFTTKTSGTGLGLAMCKRMVEQADGHIWFETELGKGTSFFIRFPLAV
jgi:signal transduction histidine kinase